LLQAAVGLAGDGHLYQAMFQRWLEITFAERFAIL
jgi:hypothetical protein